MPNEFEKQVKEKLDGLKLAPGAPVWTAVEAQIRGKKDRRFVFFWLFSFLLLTAGGFWLFNPARHGSPLSPVQHQNLNGHLSVGPAPNTAAARELNTTGLRHKNAFNQMPNTTQNISAARLARPVAFRSTRLAKPNHIVVGKMRTLTAPDQSQSLTSAEVGVQGHATSVTVPAFEFNPHIMPLFAKERLLAPEQSAPAVVRLRNRSSFRYGFVGGIGLSGIRNGVGFPGFNKSVSRDANSLTSVPQPNSYAPAPQKNGLQYQLGIVVEKKGNGHWGGSAGVTYSCFSTTMKVGARLHDTIVNSVPTPQYNNNLVGVSAVPGPWGSQTGNQSAPAQDYVNKFEYIGLPLVVNYQVSRHFPLSVYGGITPQYLVHATALQFNSNSGTYYYNKEAFNHWQWSATLGFNYPVVRNGMFLLDLGPQLIVGSAIEKNNYPVRHLVAVGLTARFLKEKSVR